MPAFVSRDKLTLFNTKRDMILELFNGFWQAYGSNRIVHCLWYGIKHNSQLKKEGINSITYG
jgi:hypothetical protein